MGKEIKILFYTKKIWIFQILLKTLLTSQLTTPFLLSSTIESQPAGSTTMNNTATNKFEANVSKNKKNPFSISPISGENAETGHRKKKHRSLNKKSSLTQAKPQLNPEEESKSASSGRSNTSHQENSNLTLNPQSPSAEAFSQDQQEIFVLEETSEAQGREPLTAPALLAQRGEISLNSNEIPEQEVEIENNRERYARSLLTGFCERTAAISFLRRSYVISISVFVCSSAALALKDIEKLMPILFLVGYFCLVYQVVENLIQNIVGRTASEKRESVFDIAEDVFLIIFLFSLNLYYYNSSGFGKIFMLIVPPLFLGEILLYMKKSSLPQTEKETKIIVKILYLVQSALIAAKINNLTDSDWKWTLIVLWVYLGAITCYIVFAGLLLISVTFASTLQLNTEVLSVLKVRILGYIWHLCFYGLNSIALVILIGVFQKAEAKNEEYLLEFGLKAAKNVSFFLLIFTILAFPCLKKSCTGPFQDFSSRTQDQDLPHCNPRKTHKLSVQSQNKTAFFLMISPSYFGFLKSGAQPPTREQIQKTKKKFELSQDQENSNDSSLNETRQKQEDIIKLSPRKGGEREENLCYICENNVSNAILTECGHGGVCCDCAIKSIEQKNECMGCRKPVGAIYKVEESSSKLGVVKAHEIIQVITIDD